MNPMNAVEQIMYGDLSRMRHVFRYSAQPVITRENVAEHSFWTALIAMTIAGELGHRHLFGEVAKRALLHDIEETLTGDLVRSMKYFDVDTRAAIAKVEVNFASKLFDSLGQVGRSFHEIWTLAKDKTLAGRIVGLADLLCVLSYVEHERILGNATRQLSEIDTNCRRLVQDKFANDSDLGGIAARFQKSAVTSKREGTD